VTSASPLTQVLTVSYADLAAYTLKVVNAFLGQNLFNEAIKYCDE